LQTSGGAREAIAVPAPGFLHQTQHCIPLIRVPLWERASIIRTSPFKRVIAKLRGPPRSYSTALRICLQPNSSATPRPIRIGRTQPMKADPCNPFLVQQPLVPYLAIKIAIGIEIEKKDQCVTRWEPTTPFCVSRATLHRRRALDFDCDPDPDFDGDFEHERHMTISPTTGLALNNPSEERSRLHDKQHRMRPPPLFRQEDKSIPRALRTLVSRRFPVQPQIQSILTRKTAENPPSTPPCFVKKGRGPRGNWLGDTAPQFSPPRYPSSREKDPQCGEKCSRVDPQVDW
jgi:hypothetical protein